MQWGNNDWKKYYKLSKASKTPKLLISYHESSMNSFAKTFISVENFAVWSNSYTVEPQISLIYFFI